MNTSQTHQIRTFALASAVAVILTMVASPAMAQHARTDQPVCMPTSADLRYARPLSALDGQTLAQYLEEHQQGDYRTFAGV